MKKYYISYCYSSASKKLFRLRADFFTFSGPIVIREDDDSIQRLQTHIRERLIADRHPDIAALPDLIIVPVSWQEVAI